MATIGLSKVSKSFGTTDAVREVDLEIADGEFTVLVGPSGCGKTTTLRMIAGLETATSGTIRISDRDVTGLEPKDRNVAMVFQNYALYPHLDVRHNIGFALEAAGVPRPERDRRVDEVARSLGIEHLLDRRPRALSGGQQQRVAIARAIVREPDVFLFDEPLSNLDAKLRVDTRIELLRLQRRLAATMVYVTHDQEEAMTLADRLVVMDGGEIVQQAHPRDVYRNPATLFVARFLGAPEINVLEGAGDGDAFRAGPLTVAGPAPVAARHVAFRPDAVLPLAALPHAAAAEAVRLAGVVDVVELLGPTLALHIDVDGTEVRMVVGEAEADRFPEGQRIELGIDPRRLLFFDADGARVDRDPHAA